MTRKLASADRKKQILDAAVTLARQHGYQHIKRENIAAALGVSCGLINLHFETMAQLKRAVMGAAIAQRIPEIIAQGLVAKDARAMKAPDALKQQALASLIG